MTSPDLSLRKSIAALAASYLAGSITFDQFFDRLPDSAEESEDDLVSELLDLIEHEPKEGGFFGASPQEYAQHRARMGQLIDSLRSAEAT